MADVGVRPARRADAAAVADIQVRAWRQAYKDLLPAEVFSQVTSPAAQDVWRERWTDAVTSPPSPQHHLLVAVSSDLVVGFAAYGPAEDDSAPSTTAELLNLHVDPTHTGAGHGSRLLAATVDLLREAGFTTLITWAFEEDEPFRAFLGSAGWAPDGTARDLDMGTPVRQVRLHTDISP